MAVMSEWLEHKEKPWTEEWTGPVLKCKPDTYDPYKRSYIVRPREYEGSPKNAVPCLVINCADSTDAKSTFYFQLKIDPSTQYTDTQVYDPSVKPASAPIKAKLSEVLPARGVNL